MRIVTSALLLLIFVGPAWAQAPDLELTASWEQLPASTTARVTLTVTNIGTAPADPSKTATAQINVILYTDSATKPAVETPADFENTLPPDPLPAGESVQFVFDVPYPLPGSYHAWAFTDSVSFSANPALVALALPEVSKANNKLDLQIEITEPKLELPNLAISKLTAQVTGNKVVFSGAVTNSGDDDAGPFVVNLYRDSASVPTSAQLPDEKFVLEELAAGDSFTFESEWEPAPNGSYVPWLCADHPQGSVVEHNEDDNCLAGTAYSVTLLGDFPDLLVTGFEWASKGADIEYTITVANEGTGFAGELSVDMWFGSEEPPSCLLGQADVHKLLPGLAAGSETTITVVQPGPLVLGQHAAWVLLDCQNDLAELNETNNAAGPINVNVSQADLAITAFNATPECTQVILAVAVENQGNFDTAGPFELHLFFDRSINPGFDGIADAVVEMAALKAGENHTVVFDEWIDAEDGEHTPWVVVNQPKTQDEDNFANNIDGGTPITVDSSLCPCSDGASIAIKCNCGGTTYSSGWCCEGVWNAEKHDLCAEPPAPDPGPGPEADAGADPSAKDDAGSSSGGGEASSGGCSAAPAGRAAVPGLTLTIVLLLLGLRLNCGGARKARAAPGSR